MEERGLLTDEQLNEKKVFSLTVRGREAREALDVDGADPTPDVWRETGDGPSGDVVIIERRTNHEVDGS